MSESQQPPRPDFTKAPPPGAHPPPDPQQGRAPQGYPPHPGQGYPPHPGQGRADTYGPRPLSPSDERMWGMLAHLSAIAASLVTLSFLGPLVVFLVFKDRGRFVRAHAAEALNMTISLMVYEIVLAVLFTILTVLTLGIGSVLFGLLVVPYVVALVFCVLAAVAANQGREYRYPLIFRLVR